jgi:hypothetical protein
VQVFEGDEMMLISDKGTLVRTRTEEVSVLGRNTQGVRLIKLSQKDEKLVGLERIEEPEDDGLGADFDGELADGSESDAQSDVQADVSSDNGAGNESDGGLDGDEPEADADGETLQ